MKITDVVTTAIRVPLTHPAKWSGGTRQAAPALLVRVYTDEGLVGIGECNGPTLPTIKTIVDRELRPFLLGQDPMRVEYIVHRMDEFVRNWSQLANYAIAGLEMALLDLKGMALGVPVADLLGGVCKEEVPYMGYLFIDSPEANARRAKEFLDQGFTELKLKVGRDLAHDADTLAAIRDAVGGQMKIRVDANMNWSVPTAIRWIKELQKYDLQFVEQPVPDYDLPGMAAVRRAVDVPIGADESCTSVWSVLQLLKHEACDVFVVYLSEAGGLSKARQIAAIADAAGKWCVTGTWAELGVGTMASAHVIASSPNFPFANDTHYPLQASDIITEPLQFRGGKLRLPKGPGLGVALDEAKVSEASQSDVRESVFYDEPQEGTTPRIGQIL
jgi:L-alanine-DL-glutamate epimerase-like enolase superfamily enzyme